jgi:PAS domain S-box-containing protein
MSTPKRVRHGAAIGWVLLTLLAGGLLELGLASQPWQPGDLLTPYERVPYAILVACVTALLAVMQAQWLLGRSRRRELEAQRTRLASIVQNASDAIIGESADGRVVFWNLAAVRLFGHTEAECQGKAVADLLFPPDRAGQGGTDRQRLVSPQAQPAFDTVCWHRSGQRIDVSVAVSPIDTPDGQFTGCALHIRDISERKAHERQLLDLNARLEDTVRQRTLVLEKAEQDLRTVLDAVPAMIGYWDCDLFNRVANRAYHEGLGIEAGRMPGRSACELLGPALFERSRCHIEAVLRGEPQVFERSMKSPDGEGERRSLAHYIPDRLGDQVLGFYAVVHDITEQHESRRRWRRHASGAGIRLR